MILYFIHGSGCDAGVFAAQTAAFDGARAVTLPGRGGDASAPASIEAFADFVAEDLAGRDIGDAVLCGSSMGGAIALELALRGNPRVRALVALGSGAKLRVAPALFESLERDFESGARSLVPHFYAEPTPERIEASLQTMLAVGRDQTLRDFRACDAFDATARIGELTVPLLAITGSADVLTPPKYGQFLADRVPGATARIVDGAGHLAMVERPAQTNAAIRAFVDAVETR
jgi:3-oxoadipate enol-lactonase